MTASNTGTPASSASPVSSAQRSPSSGIFGHLVGAWGNPPARIPATKCIKVFDASGTKLVIEGICTGAERNFRIPLEPGSYVVEFGGHWERGPGGGARFVPERRRVNVQPGHWADISPAGPPGPVP